MIASNQASLNRHLLCHVYIISLYGPHGWRHPDQLRFRPPSAMEKAPPFSTFSAWRNVKLVRVPLTPFQLPLSRRLSMMVASPNRSAFAMATTSASGNAGTERITSSVRAEMPWRCEVYRLDERMRRDLGRSKRCARGMAAMGLAWPSVSAGSAVAVMGGDGEVAER